MCDSPKLEGVAKEVEDNDRGNHDGDGILLIDCAFGSSKLATR
jgi:hypothetical protein